MANEHGELAQITTSGKTQLFSPGSIQAEHPTHPPEVRGGPPEDQGTVPAATVQTGKSHHSQELGHSIQEAPASAVR